MPSVMSALAPVAQQAKRFGVHLAKRAVKGVFDRLRGIEGLPLARGKLSGGDVIAGHLMDFDGAAFRQSFWVREELAAEGTDGVPHRPVETYHLLLDTTDPRFCCRNNLVTGPGNIILYEDECAFEHMSVRGRLLERPRRVAGTVAYLSNTTPDNYYHWLCLTLPLVGLYRTRLGVEPDHYYTGRPLTPWHLETLARAGITPDRVLSEPVCADRLVADIANRKGAVDTAMLAFTRNCFVESRTKPSRRLFVGRRNTRHRRFLNESQCADHAARYGFEYVTMEGRSVAEQARLFAEADFVIGPHGAALTNLLFASPSTRALEILPYRPRLPFREGDPLLTCFREIAAFVGCPYRALIGEITPALRHQRLLEADFTLDFDRFRDRLAEMLDDRP